MKWFVVWMGILAAPAMAQDFCPGAWMGETADASDPAASALTVQTFVRAGHGYAGQFQLADGQSVRIEAKGAFGGDPLAELYDTNGTLIISDDDGGGDLAARTVVDLPAGEYCLVVRSATGGILPVEVQVSLPEQTALLPEPEGCWTLPDRAAVGSDGAVQMIPVSDPVALDLELEGVIRLRAQAADADTVLELYDANGEMIAQSDDADGLNAQIDTETLPQGKYCAILRTYEADGSEVAVTAQTLDPAMLARGRVDAGEISPMPGSDHPVTDLGTLEGRIIRELPLQAAMSWMRVELDTPGLMLIDLLAIGETDPTLVLFDEAGRPLGRNDDAGPGALSSQLAVPVTAGAYLIGLGAVAGNEGPVRLVVDLYLRVE